MKFFFIFLLLCVQSFGAITLVGHSTGSGTASTAANSGNVTTTGATLLVVTIAEHYVETYTVTDNLGNTWIPLTSQGGDPQSQIFYSYANGGSALTTGTDFAIVNGGYYPNFSFSAWSGTTTISTLDVENGNTSTSGATIQSGSVTPANAGSLLITVVGPDAGVALSIDSGFTILDSLGPNPWGMACAYIIETSIVAKNPTWTINGSGSFSVNIAVFKPHVVTTNFVANATVIVVGP